MSAMLLAATLVVGMGTANASPAAAHTSPGASSNPQHYELRGTLTDLAGTPSNNEPVALLGISSLFREVAQTRNGEFQFHDLKAGVYTLVLGRDTVGEIRKSIQIGAGEADEDGVVHIAVEFSSGEAASGLGDSSAVSLASLRVPDNARSLYRDAQHAVKSGQADRAEHLLLEAVRLSPDYAAAWNMLGVISIQSGDVNQGEYYFRKALDAEPGYLHAVVNLGGVLLAIGRYDDALQYNEVAASRLPSDAGTHAQLGMNCFHLNALDRARQELETAIEIDPAQPAELRLVLAEIYLQNRSPEKALTLLEQAREAGLPEELDTMAAERIAEIRSNASAELKKSSQNPE